MPDALINGHKCRIISRPCIRVEEVKQDDGSYLPGRAHRLPIFIRSEVGEPGGFMRKSELIEEWFNQMPWGDPAPALQLDSLTIVVNNENWTFRYCSIRPVSGGVILYYEECRYG